MKKAFFALAVLACLGLLGWRIWAKLDEGSGKPGQGGRGPGKGPRAAVAVEAVPVGRTTVHEIGLFTGSLSPRSRFVVAPKVAGRLERLSVNIGDQVAAGQLIASLDDAEYAQQVEQANAELSVAKASVGECDSALKVAGKELDRVESLLKQRLISESESDEARARKEACDAKLKVALAEVTRRQAALEAARVRQAYTQIRAVWPKPREAKDGEGREEEKRGGEELGRLVGERFVDEGAMLNANSPIVSILDNSVMIAQIDVIERDYPKIRLGQEATVTTDACPDRIFTGRVARIAPMLKDTSRQARVEVEIPNTVTIGKRTELGPLRPGMFVRARIEFAAHADAVTVPVEALARRDGRRGVFVVEKADDGGLKARFTELDLGATEGGLVQVLGGTLKGDGSESAVTMGHHLLEDGAAIRLPQPEEAPEAAGSGAAPGGRKGGAGAVAGEGAGASAGKDGVGARP